MDRVLPPQLDYGVDVDIVVVESECVGGVEDLHPLYPPHEDRVVDPGVDVSDRLDHLVDVLLTRFVGQV